MSILDQNTPQSYIPYLATGTGVFSASGSPEGVQKGGIGSIYTDLTTGDLYTKTTAYALNTGWVLVGGGGGSGTVTSVGLGGNAIFDFSGSTANPITGAGTFDIDFASQLQNRVFASPSGAPGLPAFRALTSADLALAAAPPANGVQYNDGANSFTASNGFKFDPASNTVQVGESTVLKGTVQLFAALSAGSVKHTVNNPASNYVWIWGDSLPTTNDLLKVTVSGNNVTVASIAASALGFPTINATDGAIPYRSSSTAFSDSPIVRNGANQISIGNSGAFAGLQITGNAAGSAVNLLTLSSAASESIQLDAKGIGNIFFRTSSGSITSAFVNASGVYSVGTTANRYGELGLSKWAMGSGTQLTWAPATSYGNATDVQNVSDCGIARLGIGVIRVSNSSTGAGKLAVGTSTASTANQFLVDSQGTTVIAAFFSMPGSSTVPTIKAETSGIQSFAFNPSGKLVGGCNIPTSNQQFSAIGNAKSDVSTIGNVGTGVDNLLSFAIGANVLANNGDYAEFDAFGEFAATVDTKTLKIVYGATTIFNTGAVAFGGSNWRINAKIIRTGASAGKSIVTFWCTDATTPFLQEVFITTESFTASKTVKFTGEATTNDDITQLYLESKLTVALTS